MLKVVEVVVEEADVIRLDDSDWLLTSLEGVDVRDPLADVFECFEEVLVGVVLEAELPDGDFVLFRIKFFNLEY